MKNLIHDLLSVLVVTALLSTNSLDAAVNEDPAAPIVPYVGKDFSVETSNTTLKPSDIQGTKGKELQKQANALLQDVNQNLKQTTTLENLPNVKTDLNAIKAQIQMMLTFYQLLGVSGNTMDNNCMKKQLPIYTDNVNKFAGAILYDTIAGVLYSIQHSDSIIATLTTLDAVTNSTIPDLFAFYKYLAVDMLNISGGPDIKNLPAALNKTAANINDRNQNTLANAQALIAEILGMPYNLGGIS